MSVFQPFPCSFPGVRSPFEPAGCVAPGSLSFPVKRGPLLTTSLGSAKQGEQGLAHISIVCSFLKTTVLLISFL